MSSDNCVATSDETLGILKNKIGDFLAKMPPEKILELNGDDQRLELTLLEALYPEKCCKTKDKIAWSIFYKNIFDVELNLKFKLNMALGFNNKIHNNIFIPTGLTEKQALAAVKKTGVKINYDEKILNLFQSHERSSNSGYSVFFLKKLEPDPDFIGISANSVWQKNLSSITFLEFLVWWLRNFYDNNGSKLSSTKGTICAGTKLFGNRVLLVFWSSANRELKIENVSPNKLIPNAGVRLANRQKVLYS